MNTKDIEIINNLIKELKWLRIFRSCSGNAFLRRTEYSLIKKFSTGENELKIDYEIINKCLEEKEAKLLNELNEYGVNVDEVK